MTSRKWLLCFLVEAATLVCSAGVPAQSLSVGSLGTPTGTFGPAPVTVIDLSFSASGDGNLTSATFQWSNAPCPAAMKIKVYVRVPSGQISPAIHTYALSDQRGPFDILQTTQTVALTPPLVVRTGYLIAITSLSSCGGPVRGQPPGVGFVVQGDAGTVGCDTRIDSCVLSELPNSHPLVEATDDAVSLLNNRFRITLFATDPRTGRVAVGRGVSQSDRYGFFSLPDFTGDPDFPEVIVKMADATSSPPPFGGSFWFFHSPLTDVQYTLTVTDQVTGKARVYSNAPSLPGQLCGGADTNAFQP